MSDYRPNFVLVYPGTPSPRKPLPTLSASPLAHPPQSTGNSAAKPVNGYGYPVRPFSFSFSQPSS